jgi:flagellar motor switch protein FliM
VPWVTLAPVRCGLRQPRRGRRPHRRPPLGGRRARRLREVDVDLRAEVGETHLALDDVLRCGPATSVKFDAMAGDDTGRYADGVPVHRARAGRSGARRAIQILGPFGEETR